MKTSKLLLDESIEAELQRAREIIERETNIFCPYCDHKQDNDTRYHYVSYWGEDEDKPCYCGNCGEKFLVEECVERTFKTRKTQ